MNGASRAECRPLLHPPSCRDGTVVAIDPRRAQDSKPVLEPTTEQCPDQSAPTVRWPACGAPVRAHRIRLGSANLRTASSCERLTWQPDGMQPSERSASDPTNFASRLLADFDVANERRQGIGCWVESAQALRERQLDLPGTGWGIACTSASAILAEVSREPASGGPDAASHATWPDACPGSHSVRRQLRPGSAIAPCESSSGSDSPTPDQWGRILLRKSFRRSLLGLAKNSSGGADSTILPASMNTTTSATDLANPIS